MDTIISITKSENIAVLGTGPASAMADEPIGHRPEDLLPGATSLLCFGLSIPSDVYTAPKHSAENTWRSQNLLYRRLDTIALRFSVLLEESGARAFPVYGCMPLGVNRNGTVAGHCNQLRMAEVCKIGVRGKNGLLITSQYGSRLMLGGLLTTAPLPVIRMPESSPPEPGCPPGCQDCARACPVGAILHKEKKVDIMRCLGYTARTPNMSKIKFLLLRAMNKERAARYMSLTAFDEHTFHTCSKCVSLCPYGSDGIKETGRGSG